MKNVTLENAQLIFRNFSGREEKFNEEGKRNFSILLSGKEAADLTAAGWNVKHLKAKDEGDTPQPYLQVSVSYKNRPPKMVLITSRGLTYLSEAEIDMFDWVEIETADVTLNPYEWDVSGKQGVKAYAVSVYIKIVEDYLELKWQAWADEQGSGQRALTQGQRALPPGEDYIDGEVIEQYELEEAA
jgi:hypothetical protein